MADYNYNYNNGTSTAPWADYIKNITSVEIKSGVTSIGANAFAGCTNLTSVTIPSSVTTIVKFAFKVTQWLKNEQEKEKNKNLVIINHILIDGTTASGDVTIPNSVTSIADSAFADCTNLTSVTIPSSVTEIGASAFENCSGLTTVTFEDSSKLTKIGAGAFKDTPWLAAQQQENQQENQENKNLVIINDILIDGTTASGDVNIPDNVTSIADSAFEGCSELTSATIQDSVTSIGANAFADCTNLTSVTIPNSVTSIGAGAFADCTNLTSVTIPSSVKTIGEGAFEGCSGLTTLFYCVDAIDDDGNTLDISSASVPNTATKISYTVNSQQNTEGKIEVTLTVVTLGTGVSYPLELSCGAMGEGYKITKVADSIAKKVTLNHSFGGWVVYEKDIAKHIGTCKCGANKIEAHNMGDWETTTAPTCTEDGEKVRRCTNCDYSEKETLSALGHDYKEEVIQPTKANIGGTKHRCKNCGDEYWDNFTKDDTYAQTVMPNGETIYHYCTKNDLAAETTVDVGDGQTLKVFLQDPLNVLKQKDNDVLGIDVQYIKDGSDRYKELMSQVDGDHPIEHIKFFNVYPTVNGKPVTGELPKSVYMEYEIPDGWDEEDLEMILVQDGDDQDFDEIVLNIDGKKYLAMWKNHFSPYAMIDKLSEKEAELLKSDNPNAQSLSQMRTGDETGYMIFVSALICAAATLVIFKKKKVD